MPESILSPELAVRNAWARTLQLSSSDKIQSGEEAKRAKNQMDEILKKAQGNNEIKYVNEVYSAIESTFRTLATARNGLDVNSKEVDKLREKRVADLENITTFSSNLASAIPRIATMTITSTLTGWAFLSDLLQWLLPETENIEVIILPLILALGAATGYLIHGLFVVPYNARKARRELVKTDYDKILYYKLYYNRTKCALVSLFDTVNQLYNDIFQSGFYTKAKAKDAVNRILTGMDLDEQMCKYLPKHIDRIKIDADTWVKCETGMNLEECEYFKDEVEKSEETK